MRILSIDPGFGRCGVAVLDGTSSTARLLYSSCIETAANTEFTKRLAQVAEAVTELIKEYNPECLVLEELFFSNNAKTVFHVAEIRGMLIYLAVTNSIPIVEYNPLTVKIALTGFGKASKEQVIKMVPKLIKLEKIPKYDDEYDAIALGITALAQSRNRAIHKDN